MTRAIDSEKSVRRTETVPETARVRDFDELDDAAQEFFVGVAEGVSPRDPATLPGLSEGDIVVFTDYYHIQ
ncbi:hypothetical protein [Haloplanus halobius]|uniref:hypothetical protein n=1 Tax=Haloplanus halobius TaxID=2934938 RepID=UPI00200D643D|nr:hypothetical protein [Haloplanus sp. XH21]